MPYLSKLVFNVTVANPVHIKQIPKRKTDRKDARWLCTLLLHGLVRASFMPDNDQRKLRDYCRGRLFYTWQQSKTQNRVLKILESNQTAVSNKHHSYQDGNGHHSFVGGWCYRQGSPTELFERSNQTKERMKAQKAIVAVARNCLK
ncbi:transposase [Mucilaginibacter sp. L3T2-6]|uniref:IS110 family transposase n=1 Tax=Mucilaginibacter sp. L3T2-6 TaxID=3062491 RepID=UPI0034A0B48D